MTSGRRPVLFPLTVLSLAGLIAAIVGLTASAGLVDFMPLAVVVAAGAAAIAVRRLLRADAQEVIASAPPGYRAAFIVGAALLFVQLVPLTAFIINPNIAAWSARPWTPMSSGHACSTAYWTACEAAARGDSLYDESLSSVPRSDGGPRIARPMGPVNIDPYEYPPSFLPVPALLQLITADYWAFRRFWFALTVAVLAGMAVAIARRVDRTMGSHAVWLTPFIVTAPAMIATLYMGNVQFLTIAVALGAMLLFERGRMAAGGLALGAVTAGKLYPGLLVVYLLVRRQGSAVAWTAGWAAAFAVVSVLLYGIAPWIEFLHELPGLMSGEAFAAFRNPIAFANNHSVPGLVFKLRLFGVPDGGFAAMRIVGWIYTAFALAITVWLARRVQPGAREPLAWLGILFIATMRSPFLPTYGPFPSLWLATLVIAAERDRPSVVRATIAITLLLSFAWGLGFLPAGPAAVWTTLQTVGAFIVMTLAFRTFRTPTTPPLKARTN